MIQIEQNASMIVENVYIKGTSNIYYIDDYVNNNFVINSGVFDPDNIESKYIGEDHNIIVYDNIAIIS